MKLACLVFVNSTDSTWFESGTINGLRKNLMLEILALDHESKGTKRRVWISRSDLKLCNRLYDVGRVINRRSSKSFQARFKRQIFSDVNYFGRNIHGILRARAMYLITRSFFSYLIKNPLQIVALSYPIGIGLLKFYKWRMRQKALKLAYSKDNPLRFVKSNFVLIPSSGTEMEVFWLLEIVKIMKKKSVLVIENWDNLTSKSTLPIKPDYVTVMGNKLASQVAQIHQIDKSNICVAGLPRFEHISVNKRISGKHYNKTSGAQEPLRILYAGYSLPYNEIKTVLQLNEQLIHAIGREGFILTYRPHPFAQVRHFSLSEEALRFANSGIEIEKDFNSSPGKRRPSITTDYLGKLRSFDLIVSTPTTLLLEAILLGIPCLLDCTDDGIHRTTPALSMQEYLHLEDLNEINGLHKSKSVAEMVHFIKGFYQGKYEAIAPSEIVGLYHSKTLFSTAITRFICEKATIA